ncbi:MAG: gamma-glutamyltransferase, partial [Nitrospinae bacterium]|nr:gamma-glutamyltransferase [Nitrospinota bacterium]
MSAVAAAHEKAVEAGLRVMEKGGDACDAAVAVSLALGVAEPFYSGLGGGGVALIWREGEKRARFVDFSNECPLGMEPGIFECDENGKHTGQAHSRGHRSVLIPGLLRGLEAIHREYGRKPWGDLFESAIRLADEGFPVGWFYRRQQEEPRFGTLCENYPELAGIHSASGAPLAKGALLRQPD